MPNIVVVLADDWDNGDDPVSYFTTDPKGCLDFNSSPAKPRAKLKESSRSQLKDCEHGVEYSVVICSVLP